MAADRSEYQIKINMATDASSTDQALKALAAHLQTAKKSGGELVEETTRINAAHDSVGSHAKHAGHESAEGLHEVREALHVVKDEAAGSLGPIGELIKLIASPWAFAIVGLTEAYRLWNEQLEKERENLSKNIELSREQTELFKKAHTQALLNAADASNKFAIEQKHAQDNVDLLTESMKRSIEFAKQLKTETDANATSVDALTQAWIKYRVETGKLSPQGGDAELEAERKRLRKQKEDADDTAAQAEFTAKADRAHSASAQAGIALDQIPGLEDQRTALDEQQIAAEGIRKSVDEKHDELRKAAADAAAAAQTGPSQKDVLTAAATDPLHTGAEIQERLQKALDKKTRQAEKELEQNEAVSKNYESVIHSIQREMAGLDANIDSAKKLADARRELARTLEDEAAEARDALGRSKAARAANDQNADQTGVVDKLTDLHKKISAGTATPGEQSEYANAQSGRTRDKMYRDIITRLEQISHEARGQQRKDDDDELLGRILGLIEFMVLHPNQKGNEEIARKLAELESRLNHDRGNQGF